VELRKAQQTQPDLTREIDAALWQKRAGELLREHFSQTVEKHPFAALCFHT
jgi:hypothetical protein